ncbi:hypothetical protein ACQHIV_12375 [Kribbella sp. GL6]|uniref:hypothetical protein n=1 Tax=Kribbella sp. GL6 TaxID=3419765 RepID=UPI003D01EDF7
MVTTSPWGLAIARSALPVWLTVRDRALKKENDALKTKLAAERARNKSLAKVAVELALELEQAKEELAQGATVARLPRSRTTTSPQLR